MTQRTIKQSPKTGTITHAEAKRAVQAVAANSDKLAYVVESVTFDDDRTLECVFLDRGLADNYAIEKGKELQSDDTLRKHIFEYDVTEVVLKPDT